MIPILERLLYRDTKTPVTRVLVLAPTRELAIQIFEESRKLAQFTDIRISLSTGTQITDTFCFYVLRFYISKVTHCCYYCDTYFVLK
jgi:DEAD/DEAH box helicase